MLLLPKGSSGWYAAAAHVANARGLLGNYDGLEALAHELLSMPPSTDGGVSPQIIALAQAAGRLLFGGRYGPADSLLSWIQYVQTIESQFGSPDPAALAWTYRALAVRASIAGDPGGRLRLWAASVEAFEKAGDLRNACMQRINLGESFAYVGSFAAAESTLREALSAAERMGVSALVATAKQQLAAALCELSQLDEARVLARQSVELLTASQSPRMEGMSRVRLAQILARLGDADGAEQEARVAAERLMVAPPARPHALATLAHVLLGKRQERAAHEAAREAMSLCESLGQIDEGESLVRLVCAETMHALGDVAGATRAITAARARLLARAAQIAEPTWRASFLAEVPENARTLELATAWCGPAS
jgi:tetratricopeptide (TPR) repeat protein